MNRFFFSSNSSIAQQGDSPDHEPGCDVEAIEEAKEHWKALMKQGPHLISIQMSNIASFGKQNLFLCKALHQTPWTLLECPSLV